MSFSIPNFLLKKTLGVANTLYAGTDITTETPGVTFPKVFASSQLFPYPIPPVAPTAPNTVFTEYSNTVTIAGTSRTITINASTPLNAKSKSANPDFVFSGYIDAKGGYSTTGKSTAAYGLIYTSKTYPWIQYVDRLQMTIAQNISYSYGPNSLLATSIPGNYDVGTETYTIFVNPSVGTWDNSSIVSGTEYIIEKDAGYIYFPKLNWTVSGTSLSDALAIPLVSFYRYNGTMGIPTNLGNFAGAYAQGTGAIAIGNFAGAYGQGTGSIAIGNLAGPTGMSANSIVLNASGTALYGTGPTGGFYVAPVGSYSGSTGPFTILAYGADKQIVGITGDALKALGIVGGGGGSSNFNIIKYEESSSTTFNVLGYGSNDTEVIRLPITLDAKDMLRQTTINNNLQLPNLFPGNLTYINNSGLLASSDVTTTQLINMSGVNPTNSIAIGNGAGANMLGAMNSVAIGNGAGANMSGLSNGTYKNWATPSVVANNNITGVAMSRLAHTRLYSGPTLYKSVDSGVTFSSMSSVFDTLQQPPYYNCVVSGDGNCIIGFIQKNGVNFYISRDAGKTIANRQSLQQAPLAFAISNTGDYIMLVSTGGIYITNSNNVNFGSANQKLISPPTISTASCAMSLDGRYMAAIVNGTSVYYTSYYAESQAQLYIPIGLPSSGLSRVAISSNGVFVLVSTSNTLYVGLGSVGNYFNARFVDNSSTVISSIVVSNTGQYMIACFSSDSVKGYVYYSTDFGVSWQKMTALGQDNFNSCAISEDDIYITVSTPSAVYTLNNNFGGNSVAIGNGAGQTNQAENSIAIGNGAGQSNQKANTIAINASGSPLNPTRSNGCYIAPIAYPNTTTSTVFELLGYGSDNQVCKLFGVKHNGKEFGAQLSADTMLIYGSYQDDSFANYFALGDQHITGTGLTTPIRGSGINQFGLKCIYSIVSTANVIATRMMGNSDFRIKKNIQTRTGLLNTIDKLRIVSYDHIDPTKGVVSAGVIAQEVASIDPASVMSHSEVLPNIFTLATHTQLENGMIHIVVEYTQSVDITEGATVRLMIQKTDSTNETSYDNTLVNLTPNSFDIKAWDNYDASHKIFVYGTKVQNFLTVDKGQLSMIALGGVKELYQHVKVLQSPDITIGNRNDPTVGNFKITYDADKSTLVMGSSINGFVNKQFLIHQSAPANSFSITSDGTVYNNGTLVSSDRRIKTDIESISDEECLNKINRLNVVKYNYTNPSLNGANKVIGFIAQEVREAVPEAIDITTKNIYWSNAFSFTVGQSNKTVESTYTSLSDKDGKTYTITNGVVYDASNTAVFYFRENILISVYSTPTRNDDGKMFSGSKTYDLSKDDTYVLHTHSLYKQTDVMISIATVDVSVGNIVRFVYNDKKYEGVVMTVDPSTGEGSTLKVVTPDILANGILQTYEKVIQDFHMLSKEKIFALTVGAIQDLTTANTALKSQVGTLQSQVGSLQSQLSSLITWAKGQGFTGASA
jgi:hypothetical protein